MPGSVFDAVVTVFRLHKPDTKPFLDSEIYATATRDNKSGTWRLRLRHLVSDYTEARFRSAVGFAKCGSLWKRCQRPPAFEGGERCRWLGHRCRLWRGLRHLRCG